MARDDEEIELKFVVAPGLWLDLQKQFGLVDSTPPQTLVSRYFDTPAFALRRAGYTLRVREEGGRWVQTVKSCGLGDGATRRQWNSPVADKNPDIRLITCDAAREALAGEAPTSLFTVDVKRRSVMVTKPRFTLEASFDDGRIDSSDYAIPFSDLVFQELELELKTGDRRAYFAFVRALRDACALRLSFLSKADRGFARLGDAAAGPAFAPCITSDSTVGATFKATATAALKQVCRQAQALEPDSNAETVHQLRAAARRLRGLISTFKPMIDGPRAASIKATLKRLTDDLGPARNIDVFRAGALRHIGWKKSPAGSQADFDRRLKDVRTTAYRRAVDAAHDDRFGAFALDALIWIESGPWTTSKAAGATERDRSVAGFAASALDRAYRRVEKRARRFARLNRDERHALRIAVKTLRCGVEAFAGVFSTGPGRHRRFVAAIKTLLDDLGELNDLADGGPFDDECQARLKAWRKKREARLLASAAEAMRRLKSAPQFWR